ncbi:MAG: hypothetical protein GY863_24800 [bacterium]|nr:hypothetical protein [bacterium]
MPETEIRELVPGSSFNSDMINESSGIAKSRKWDDVYWTHNDSGDEARIFAVNGKGNLIKPENADDYRGIRIIGAKNVDWEDIAVDNNGNLIIGACGNNANQRTDLSLYIVKEPDPYNDIETDAALKIPFYYPEQDLDTKSRMNFDCEAVFWNAGKLYMFTKHRSNNNTSLYRFDSIVQGKKNPVKLVSKFKVGQMVTAADASRDGKKVALLTYNSIWLFIPPGNRNSVFESDFFQGGIYWLPIAAKQCEGICFDDDQLVITNEQKDIFNVNISDLIKVK